MADLPFEERGKDFRAKQREFEQQMSEGKIESAQAEEKKRKEDLARRSKGKDAGAYNPYAQGMDKFQ